MRYSTKFTFNNKIYEGTVEAENEAIARQKIYNLIKIVSLKPIIDTNNIDFLKDIFKNEK